MSHNKRIKSWLGYAFLLPSLLGVSLLLFFPFLDVVRRSFTGAVSGEWVGLQNFSSVLSNEAFLLAMGNTLHFWAVCLPMLCLGSLLVAVILQNLGERFGLFQTAYLLPMAIPVAAVSLIWRLLFHSRGLINGWLAGIGAAGPDWMNSDWAFRVLVLAYLWRNLGYDVILWLAGLSQIPSGIYEAARVDGAGTWICFFCITLPNLRGTFYTIGVLSFLNSFRVFREAYLVAGDYPHESMYLLQHLFNNWFRQLDLDKMAAAAVLVTGGILLLLFWFRLALGERKL